MTVLRQDRLEKPDFPGQDGSPGSNTPGDVAVDEGQRSVVFVSQAARFINDLPTAG
jgi:hypothetical protein